MKLRDHCQHEQRSRLEAKIKTTKQLSRGFGPREPRLARMARTQLEMALRGEPELRFKFDTKRHHRESEEEHALGNRKHLFTALMIGGKQTGGHVTAKSFFFFINTGSGAHAVATTVCATVCVHTLRVAHTFF